MGYIPETKGRFNIWKSKKVVHNTSTVKKTDYNHLNWYRKGIWQSSISIPGKNSQPTSDTKEFTQLDKRRLWKSTTNLILNANILNALLPGQNQDRNEYSIQYCTGGSSQCNQVMKEIRCFQM